MTIWSLKGFGMKIQSYTVCRVHGVLLTSLLLTSQKFDGQHVTSNISHSLLQTFRKRLTGKFSSVVDILPASSYPGGNFEYDLNYENWPFADELLTENFPYRLSSAET